MAPTKKFLTGRNRSFIWGGVSCPSVLIGSGARQLWARSQIQHTDWFQPGRWPLVTKLSLSNCHICFLSSSLLREEGQGLGGWQCPPSNMVFACPPLPPDLRGGLEVCLHSIKFQKHGGTVLGWRIYAPYRELWARSQNANPCAAVFR